MLTKDELLKKYNYFREITNLYGFINFVVSWDSETIAPNGCFEDRAKQIGTMSKLYYDFSTNKENIEVVNALFSMRNNLDEVLKHEIVEVKKGMDDLFKIPQDEYIELNTLLAQSQSIWAKAKTENNYNLFKPTLERIIFLMKKYVSHLETKKLKGYNVLLNEYERGMTIEKYDKFFSLLKEKLVPFIKKVTEKKLEYNDSFLTKKFSIEKQKEFCAYIQDILCFNKDKGVMFESEHPFTNSFGTNDVRITVHYYEDLPISAIFSTIHELGHATYEQQIDPSLSTTLSGGGASCAMHESQSRFYENIIGRSIEFWKPHYKKLKELFKKELLGVSLNDFYKYINTVQCSLIRTEADELTYPIHIMIRYDIEKALFNGEINVDDLPSIWNKAVKDNLGIDVLTDTEGVLQDVHWSGGSFGYFPTYALGSAYAAQFYNAMKKDINIKECLLSGNTKVINDWLKEKVHKYGSTMYPLDILKKATNEKFKPKYYVDYLIKKYSKIYKIKK